MRRQAQESDSGNDSKSNDDSAVEMPTQNPTIVDSLSSLQQKV